MPVPDRLLPCGVPRHLGYREVHLGEALAVLRDHVIAPFPAVGAVGSGPGQLISPTGLDVGPNGNVYVTDVGADRILKYDKTGALLAVWGKSGRKAGEFDKPTGIAVDGEGNLYVAEYNGRRIQKVRLP